MSTTEAPAADGTPPDGTPPDGASRRWLVLFTGLFALTAGCTFQYGIAYLIPSLRASGFSLELAGLIVACPTAGLLLTLIAWGAAADRFGERLVLAAGLALAGLVLLTARQATGPAALGALLALAGAAGGSVFAASGRLILGWFARRERGLAMGIRQSAQPLGVAIAAVTLPSLGLHGRGTPLLFLAGFCLVAAIAVVALVRDPARPEAGQAGHGTTKADPAASPYRQHALWRIHGASGRPPPGRRPGPRSRRAPGRRVLVRPGRQPPAAHADPGPRHRRGHAHPG